jgi:hypothetical protein
MQAFEGQIKLRLVSRGHLPIVEVGQNRFDVACCVFDQLKQAARGIRVPLHLESASLGKSTPTPSPRSTKLQRHRCPRVFDEVNLW